ncbi:MAG: SDR family NAD(P)-dependent oxidoreductase [Sphingomonadales bacterium]
MQNPKSILITGASAGIGAALAFHYAGPGVTLALSGRNADRLDGVADRCRELGADVITAVVDVADAAGMIDWIDSLECRSPPDLVIANAGISLGLDGPSTLHAHVTDTFRVNVNGVFNTIHPAIDRMLARGGDKAQRGQVAIVSSLAGFHGLPSAPGYSTSKATVRAYGEALRGFLAPHGIAVNVICPGFIVSDMTANNRFPMPFLMSADRAARIISRGLARNRGRIAFPFPMIAAVRILGALPASWIEALFRRFPVKA